MKMLQIIRDSNVFNGSENLSSEDWFKRQAARAVLFDKDGRVYLLKMSTYNYHKLPGGGVNNGESFEDAVRRELLEEVGCPADVSTELGEIVEYRNDEKMEQHSYCYIAHQSGNLIETALEESESEEGAETVSAHTIDEAIKFLENDQPTNYEGHFIQMRDLRFLREARSVI